MRQHREAWPTEERGSNVEEIRISPAGDGFYAAAKHPPSEAGDETPRGCALCMSSGFVFFGVEEDGEETVEAVACRRCHSKERRLGVLVTMDGERVRTLREERRMSRRVLAEEAGISVSTVANVEQGAAVRLKTVRGLGAALGVDFKSLGRPARA